MNIYSLYVIYYTRYFWWDWSQVQEQVQKFNLQHQGCQEWWIVQKNSFERFVGNWGNLTRGVFRNLSRGGLHFLSFQGGWLSTRKPPKSIDFTGPGELSPHCHPPPEFDFNTPSGKNCTHTKTDHLRFAQYLWVVLFERKCKKVSKFLNLPWNSKKVESLKMWRSKFYYCKVVSMSADEYASKELHAWREETAKKDLEVKSILT